MRLGARSLQGRVLGLVVGLVAAVWIATAITTWVDASHELDELLDGHLAQAAALLVVQQTGEIEEHHRVQTPALHRYAPKVAFQVFHEGRLVLESENAPRHPMLDPDGFRAGFRTVTIDGAAWRVFATQGRERDVQVYVCEQVRSRESILWAVLESALWPMALALPFLALAIWWAVHRGVAPLRQLGRTLARRDPRALEPVSLPDAPSEMSPMVDALNGLFARIAELLESERRFTADAAHELRTPIAAIRAQAQVALGAADAPGRRRALEATLEGCDRLVRLVEQLLTLARVDATAAQARSAADLTGVVRRVAADVAAKAVSKGQALELHAAGELRIAGDETLLAILVRNLVDNAVRYSPPGARIAISLHADGRTFTLEVADSGPGMTDGELGRLGERFFRVAGNEESGSGLGWSIVRHIAASAGWRVRAQRSRLGGLAVLVTGPLA